MMIVLWLSTYICPSMWQLFIVSADLYVQNGYLTTCGHCAQYTNDIHEVWRELKGTTVHCRLWTDFLPISIETQFRWCPTGRAIYPPWYSGEGLLWTCLRRGWYHCKFDEHTAHESMHIHAQLHAHCRSCASKTCTVYKNFLYVVSVILTILHQRLTGYLN